MFRLITNPFGISANRAAPRKSYSSSHQYQPNVEALEQREVMSSYIVDGNIVINQTAYNDRADVDLINGQWFRVIDNGSVSLYHTSQVWRGNIYYYGGNGDDVFFNNTNLRSTAYGEAGRDYLFGGGNTDHLYGGSENDRLDGRGGNDFLHGEGQSDELYGGAGADVLHGDSYDNDRFGQSGNDYLDGGFDRSRDKLYGHLGYDTYVNYYRYGPGYGYFHYEGLWYEDELHDPHFSYVYFVPVS